MAFIRLQFAGDGIQFREQCIQAFLIVFTVGYHDLPPELMTLALIEVNPVQQTDGFFQLRRGRKNRS